MIADPINLLDSSPMADGAAAVILCPTEQAREFTDKMGRRWRVAYTEGTVRGMITLPNIVFEALDQDERGEQRYLSVHPGYLESVDDHQLEVALAQAMRVDPPW